MKLLNVGCGSNRPQDEHWWNIDHLHAFLNPGTPERKNLDAEPRYIDHDLREGLPCGPDMFDGILCSHVVEHFSAHAAVALLRNCHTSLKPGGLLVVSVPDAEYFLKVYDRDKPENAVELFGEPISADEPWQKSFFDYALFHREHQQILTYASLECLLRKAGFGKAWRWSGRIEGDGLEEIEVAKVLNRKAFSVIVKAIKSA